MTVGRWRVILDEAGRWLLAAGFWLLVAGYREYKGIWFKVIAFGDGYRLKDAGYLMPDAGFGMPEARNQKPVASSQ